MRELKFRTWNWLEDRYDEQPCAFISTSGELTPSINRIIEQYTGLKDRNGKEIYEGDIIENTLDVACNKSKTYQVFYKTDFAKFEIAPIDGKIDIASGYFNFASMEHFEVIGNIHEDPELLEEEK